MPNQQDKVVEQNEKNKYQKNPGKQSSRIKSKAKEGITVLLAIFGVIICIAVVVGGIFYFFISRDINGFAQKNRNTISHIPIFKMALPKPVDPDDPKYLSSEELINKYNELRKQKNELQQKLEEDEKKIAELQKFKDDQDKIFAEQEKQKKDIEEQKSQLDSKIAQYLEDKKKLDEMIASGDKEGFKEYFEKIDKDMASKLYEKILTEQKANDSIVQFAQLYEAMDSQAAAKIMEQMGETQIDLITDVLKNMKRNKASEIMSLMDPSFAAKLAPKLADAFKQ